MVSPNFTGKGRSCTNSPSSRADSFDETLTREQTAFERLNSEFWCKRVRKKGVSNATQHPSIVNFDRGFQGISPRISRSSI